MNPIEKHILDSFVTMIKKKIHLNRVVLFGSRARGDADPGSDMDVLVIVEELKDETQDYISECAWEAGFEHGIILVPVVFSKDDWENGPERYSLLAEAIRSEGVTL
ncbi:MAG: nucleotidyltransferase domain-containing protein [bacterium]|nr:MAG: nucleotidyltransferase domain-containing protein [bacterium]